MNQGIYIIPAERLDKIEGLLEEILIVTLQGKSVESNRLSIEEAAKYLGCSGGSVRNYINRGLLVAGDFEDESIMKIEMDKLKEFKAGYFKNKRVSKKDKIQ